MPRVLPDLFGATRDAAVVQMEKAGGPALGAGRAVGVQVLQIFRVARAAGHPGDDGHVGVVARDVLGHLGEQRRRAQVVVVDDGFARGGEAKSCAGFAPRPAGTFAGSDARTYACGKPARIDGGGQDDAHVKERCRFHRAGRPGRRSGRAEVSSVRR